MIESMDHTGGGMPLTFAQALGAPSGRVAVLSWLYENGPAHSQAIAENTGLSKRHVNTSLRALEDLGIAQASVPAGPDRLRQRVEWSIDREEVGASLSELQGYFSSSSSKTSRMR